MATKADIDRLHRRQVRGRIAIVAIVVFLAFLTYLMTVISQQLASEPVNTQSKASEFYRNTTRTDVMMQESSNRMTDQAISQEGIRMEEINIEDKKVEPLSCGTVCKKSDTNVSGSQIIGECEPGTTCQDTPFPGFGMCLPPGQRTCDNFQPPAPEPISCYWDCRLDPNRDCSCDTDADCAGDLECNKDPRLDRNGHARDPINICVPTLYCDPNGPNWRTGRSVLGVCQTGDRTAPQGCCIKTAEGTFCNGYSLP